MSSAEIERALEAKIDPWLAHMRWRTDYTEWRHKRLWQENFQARHLNDLRHYTGLKLADAQVLDIGSGMGGFAVALARDARARVVACDFNPAYNEIARLRAMRYDLALQVLTAVGEALPFPGGTFDILTAWDVLEHAREPRRFLAECARVLKPHGFLFLTAINRLALRDPHYHLLFVNWLPRPLAEWVIARRGRSKTASQLQDRQKLSEMHYFTYPAFTRLAHQFGFRCLDARAERVTRVALHPRRTDKHADLLHTLFRLSLLRPSYWLYRTFVMGTFELVLSKA